MMRKLSCGIHFGDSSDEDEDKLTLDNFNPEKHDIMMLPFSVKLITPYLLYRFPDIVEFLRYDLRNYPKVILKENAPYPYPFLEVYNMKGVLLHEVDLSCKTRADLNALLYEYQQLPKSSHQWLKPPPRPPICANPDLGEQYQPGDRPQRRPFSRQKYSDISPVETNFTASTPDTVMPE